MNGDHPEDNLLIVRAFGAPDATASKMVGLDAHGGTWHVTDPSGEREVRVAWPSGAISERPEIRREIVALYHAACEKLGVPAREEHAPSAGAHGAHAHGAHGDAAAHGDAHGAAHPHGGGDAHGGGHPHAKPEDDGTFSFAIRSATWGDHGDSEGTTVMEDIMRMRAPIEVYTDLVVQHYFMYEALEAAAEQLAADPRYAALHPAALVREQQLAEDLELLLGEKWREKVQAVPATKAYADRIREVAAEGWLPGIIAHHYTRYLGDLSGGQMIAKRVKKQHGFDRAGVAFYDFTELGSIAEFKQTYRSILDELGESLDASERERMVDEVRAAYRFNTEVFLDMQNDRQSLAV
jgi:heme oxygenase